MMIFKVFIFFCITWIACFQTVPETVPIIGLPNQTQDVYQGWILSDNQTESYLYYQLFSAESTTFNASNNPSIPLLMYLEGGPGDSSTLTLWSDFGPYGVNSNINMSDNNNLSDIRYTLYKRDITWSTNNHILSVDSPIFTGYSFSATGAVMNSTEGVGTQLVAFLTRFYQLYPQLEANPLFIIGHSYGGHWAPYLAYLLVKNNNLTLNGNKISFGSVVLLNPLVSLQKQLGEADYFYSAGVTDTNKRDFIKGIDDQLQKFFYLNQIGNASIGFVQEQNFLVNGVPGEVITSNVTLDNIRRNKMPNNKLSYAVLNHTVGTQTYFDLPLPTNLSGRNFLNIPDNVKFLEGYTTSDFVVSGDAAIDFAYTVEYLLDQGLHVIFLGAQDDGTVPVPTVVDLVSSLNWTYADSFRNTLRDIWLDDDMNVLGAFKKYGNLNIVTLYNSGHLVTFDQPEAMVKFINRTTTFTWQ